MSANYQYPSKVDVSQGISIDDQMIQPGQQGVIRINAGKLPSDNRINVFAHVFNSGKPGPVLLVMGGVHGDEINGIEIVRKSIESRFYDNLISGGAVVIPLLNIYGFINFSRHVPDGKDVNRSFPGHLNGSLASRIARIVTLKILPVVDFAIDFHTGGGERYNFPQVRFHPQDHRASRIADVFGAPVKLETSLIPNSFRRSAADLGVPAIVYEGGESVRLDKHAIDTGLAGIKNVMSFLQIQEGKPEAEPENSLHVEKSSWLRSPVAGMFFWYKNSGEFIQKNELLGVINDPYGIKSTQVLAKSSGFIIGHNNASVVNQGDPLFHIGTRYKKSFQTDHPSF